MSICCVPACANSSNHTFKFPNDPDLQEKWCRAIPRANFNVTKWSRVCSNHFDEKLLINYDECINAEGILIFSDIKIYHRNVFEII